MNYSIYISMDLFTSPHVLYNICERDNRNNKRRCSSLRCLTRKCPVKKDQTIRRNVINMVFQKFCLFFCKSILFMQSPSYLPPLPQPYLSCAHLSIGILCGLVSYLVLHPSGLLTGLIGAPPSHFSHFQFCGNYFVKVYITSGIFSVQIYQTLGLFQKSKKTTKPLQTHSLQNPD